MSIAMNQSRRTPFVLSKNEEARRKEEEEAKSGIGEEGHWTVMDSGTLDLQPVTPRRRKSRRQKPAVRTFCSLLKGLTDALEQAKGKIHELEQWHKDWETKRMIEDVAGSPQADAAPGPISSLLAAANPADATDGFVPIVSRRVVTFEVDEVPAERRPGDPSDVKAAIPVGSIDAFQSFEACNMSGADSARSARAESSLSVADDISCQFPSVKTAPSDSFRDHAPAMLLPDTDANGQALASDAAAVDGVPYTPPGLARLSVSSICMVPLGASNGGVGAPPTPAELVRDTSQATSDGGSVPERTNSKLSKGNSSEDLKKLGSNEAAKTRSLTTSMIVMHNGGLGVEEGNEPTSEALKSESSSSGEEEQARMRTHWENFDVQAIVKYEKELMQQEHRMKRTSSKMSPASVASDLNVKRSSLFRWRTRSTTSNRQNNPEPIVPSMESDDTGIPCDVSKKSLNSEVTTFQALHRHSSFHGTAWQRRLPVVCHPQGMQRLFWDIASIVLISYDMITLPMYAFAFQSTPRLELLEWCCTVFWTVDILMSFRTGYYKGHQLVIDLPQVARHYMKTWFLIDIFIVVPEWIARTLDWVIEGLNAARIGRVSRFVRFVRLIRIVKMGHFSDKIEEILGNNMMLLGFSLTKLSVILALAVHFLTCIWYGIGSSDHGSWVANEDMQNEALLAKYVAAARWTLAQINGRTDQVMDRTMAEKGYTVACAFFTVLFMSIFVSTLTTRMMELQKLMDEETRYTKMLMNYLEHKKVSFSVSYLAKMYVKNNKRMQSEQDTEKHLMSVLPKSLKVDLLYEVRSPMISYHGFFADIKADFQKVTRVLCSNALDLVPVTTAEVTFQKDEESDKMYILERGDMRYAEHANLTHHVAKMKDAMAGRSRKSVFSGVDRATSAVVGGMLGTGHRHDEVAQHIPGVPLQNEGTIICEGALWTEWRTHGELIAVSMSMLMALKVDTFSKIVCSVKETHCRAARYARLFQWYISQMDHTELSDLTVMKTSDLPHAGQRISMLANQAKWS